MRIDCGLDRRVSIAAPEAALQVVLAQVDRDLVQTALHLKEVLHDDRRRAELRRRDVDDLVDLLAWIIRMHEQLLRRRVERVAIGRALQVRGGGRHATLAIARLGVTVGGVDVNGLLQVEPPWLWSTATFNHKTGGSSTPVLSCACSVDTGIAVNEGFYVHTRFTFRLNFFYANRGGSATD